MYIGADKTVGELDHCVAEVDDAVAGERFDVTPFCAEARREDLEAAKAVEKDGDRAKVGVLA